MSVIVLFWLVPLLAAAGLLLFAVQTQFWRVASEAAAGLLLAGLPFLFVSPFTWPTTIILVVLQLWLLVLPVRLLFGRLDKPFLYISTRKNTIIALLLVALVLLGYMAMLAWPQLAVSYTTRLLLVISLSIVVALVMLSHLLWTMKHYAVRAQSPPTPQALPTVSLCIPARNETQALEQCIMAALASDYPKLEIIVLDDCSQDKTSQIIRSFAHDGVQFIQGDLPADGWLGKNQAMSNLATQANGDYLIFAGVDTIFSPESISRIVRYALATQAKMVSVLPQNKFEVAASTMLGTLQYFWRIALPIGHKHVPVASKCWLITADALKKLGGFGSVRQKVVPEGSFASRLFAEDTYRFVIGSDALGVTSAKKWSSQIETSERLLYPGLKRQPMYVLLAGTAIGTLFILPFVLTIWLGITAHVSLLFWFSLVASVLLLATYALVLMRTLPKLWWLAMWLLPLALVQEGILLLVSATAYEFGTVNWKGRNVCYPVIAPFVRQAR